MRRPRLGLDHREDERDYAVRDEESAVIPAAHVDTLAKRTAALIGILIGIDSSRRLLAEVAILDRCALALGVCL